MTEADRLVSAVMRDRDYPMDDFDERSADISVDPPHVVDDYRAAHAISMANDHAKANTEDLEVARAVVATSTKQQAGKPTHREG